MELRKIIDQAKDETGLCQDKLAERIGLNRTALSHILHGRRKLPAEAAIELYDITGIHPREILKATTEKKATMHAALWLIGFVCFFMTPPENTARASSTYGAASRHNVDSQLLRRLRNALKKLARTARGWGMLRPT